MKLSIFNQTAAAVESGDNHSILWLRLTGKGEQACLNLIGLGAMPKGSLNSRFNAACAGLLEGKSGEADLLKVVAGCDYALANISERDLTPKAKASCSAFINKIKTEAKAELKAKEAKPRAEVKVAAEATKAGITIK